MLNSTSPSKSLPNGRLTALFFSLIIVCAVAGVNATEPPQQRRSGQQESGAGSLEILDSKGATGESCPLKHTDVQAEISGAVARVTVTQEFSNTSDRKIEAVYVFPLPQNAAVDDMTMKVADRTIRGVIKQRDEARKIYENAKQQGHVASLLDQERPNIFTQSVANITPGAAVTITISYVELLTYEEGSYQFMFPMVVGPRYIPGRPIDSGGQSGGGWSRNTTRVPDASRITPPVAKPGTRAGHDISVSVKLDAGVPIQEIRSELHKVDIDRTGASSARVTLQDRAEIPNRDFILRYDVAGSQITDAILTHRKGGGDGYFALVLQPPERFAASDVTPKELVFVLDTSGSMSGLPIEKGKDLVGRALKGLNANDTFNLITFSGDTSILFPEPVSATAENLSRAQEFLRSRKGGGGTEMMKAIRAALAPSDEQDHIRIVIFVTDGYVGNDMEILGEVQKHPNARVFSFGIGSSVNRFLLDGMAREGRGEVEYVTLQGDADASVERLYQRVRSPLLTDITVDYGGLKIEEVYPSRLLDLFAARPVVLYGRYSSPGTGTITLRGKRSGEAWSRQLKVSLPDSEAAHDVLGTLWARRKIDELMAQDWKGLQRGTTAPDIEKQITDLGLQHRLMTQFTSFVAVEEQTVTDGGTPVTVQVPVEMPEGVSYEGVFGEQKAQIGAVVGGVAASAPVTTAYMTAAPSKRAYNSVDLMARTETPVPAPPPMSADQVSTVYEAKSEAEGRKRRERLDRKLDARLLEAWECDRLESGDKTLPTNCSMALKGPRVRVEITLDKATAQGLAELRRLGFVAELSAGKLVGTVPLANLHQIAALENVALVKWAPGAEQSRK